MRPVYRLLLPTWFLLHSRFDDAPHNMAFSCSSLSCSTLKYKLLLPLFHIDSLVLRLQNLITHFPVLLHAHSRHRPNHLLNHRLFTPYLPFFLPSPTTSNQPPTSSPLPPTAKSISRHHTLSALYHKACLGKILPSSSPFYLHLYQIAPHSSEKRTASAAISCSSSDSQSLLHTVGAGDIISLLVLDLPIAVLDSDAL